MKPCPFCAEEIQDAAIVCKHCGRDLPKPQPRAVDRKTQRQGMLTLLAALIILSLIGWVLLSSNPDAANKETSGYRMPEWERVGRSGDLYFVVLSPAAAESRASVERIARGICRPKSRCGVRFWTARAYAATSLPMTEEQAAAIYASYSLNKSTGVDELTCHPYGTAAERCN